MTALTIGITSARYPECKRGLAVNVAASLARDPERGRVCVVDADPLALDVTTRFAVRGPHLEDFAQLSRLRLSALGSVHEPPLSVLPSAGGGVGVVQRAAGAALPGLRAEFDIVVCDVLGGPAGPERVLGDLDPLDWLLVAVTPDVEPVEATASFLAHLDGARDRGEIAGSVRVGLVVTGDESSLGTHGAAPLSAEVIASALACPVVGSVPQLWGRAAPNLGFGAALGIAELDDAVAGLADRLRRVPGRPNPAFSRVP